MDNFFHSENNEDEPPQGVTVPVQFVGRIGFVVLFVCQVFPCPQASNPAGPVKHVFKNRVATSTRFL